MWARLLFFKFLAKWASSELARFSRLFLLGILGQVRNGSAVAEKHVFGCLDWVFNIHRQFVTKTVHSEVEFCYLSRVRLTGHYKSFYTLATRNMPP